MIGRLKKKKKNQALPISFHRAGKILLLFFSLEVETVDVIIYDMIYDTLLQERLQKVLATWVNSHFPTTIVDELPPSRGGYCCSHSDFFGGSRGGAQHTTTYDNVEGGHLKKKTIEWHS